LVDALHALSRRLGLPARLRDIGVTRDSLAAMAEVSMDDWFVRDNPRNVRSAAELETLLADAW
ncbi:MAG: iron-containing alcohol dehydrogenase, partial [Gemmatimonadales bacterium]|nr:iron-containing alcohol dehydrogenase [Gemmatimonadales bacterium]